MPESDKQEKLSVYFEKPVVVGPEKSKKKSRTTN